MATQSAILKFGLPEDESSNQLLIYSSTTKAGTYSLAATVTYSYGETTYEYDALDDTKWYKIRFNNSVVSEYSAYSDAVYGGNFSQSAPFLAISSGTDGAQFATIDEVYLYSGLNNSQVPRALVSQALHRARAIIDIKTIDFDIDRFTDEYESDVSRKKYNAQLQIIREAEINYALGHIYRGLSDDVVIASTSGTTNEKPAVSVGGISLGTEGGLTNVQQMSLLAALGDRYLAVGAALLALIQPGSLRLTRTDYTTVRSPKFLFPFNGWS
jgi:hypothetical protein